MNKEDQKAFKGWWDDCGYDYDDMEQDKICAEYAWKAALRWDRDRDLNEDKANSKEKEQSLMASRHSKMWEMLKRAEKQISFKVTPLTTINWLKDFESLKKEMK